MCQPMMQMEMCYTLLKLAALALVGTLVAAALALFVVLEIQWIRYWHRRLKAQRSEAP